MATDLSLASIGIFDSGFGGLTVMRAVTEALPHENIIYFGDTARLPYGNKSRDTLIRFSFENARFLIDQGIKVLVVACHTACAAALDELQESCSIPVIGVIPSAIDDAIRHTQSHLGIIGTRSTVQSGVYQTEIHKRLPYAQIQAIACPLFVPLVEEGFIDHPITTAAIQEYLSSLDTTKLECLILGCTHYPLLAPLIQQYLGPHITLIDPAKGCAERVRRLLHHHNLLNPQRHPPHYQFFASDDPDKFRTLGPAFLRHPIPHVQIAPVPMVLA